MEKERNALERENVHDRSQDENDAEEEGASMKIASSEAMVEGGGEQKAGTSPIPADFRCPLSLELMSDPVIVASGQTYERTYIQHWLDQGNTNCPKTRQTLTHTNLIPNYTVKALITNWCEANNIPFPESSKNDTLSVHGRPLPIISARAEGDEKRVETPFRTVHESTTTQGRHTQDRPMSGVGSRASPATRRSLVQKSSDERQFEGNGYHSRGDEHGEGSPTVPRNCSPQYQDGDESLCRISATKEKHDADAINNPSPSGNHHHRTGSGSSVASSLEDGQGSPSLHESSAADRVLTPIESSPYQSDVSGELQRLSIVGAAGGSEEAAHRLQDKLPNTPQEKLLNTPRRRRPDERVPSLPVNVASPAQDSLGTDGNALMTVDALVLDLKSEDIDVQRRAAAELRLLAKYNMENRITIANAGAIRPLVALLKSTDSKTQENAVTALLNLSINDKNKSEIAAAGAIDPLVNVLNVGNAQSMENAAATLYSLSVIDDNKVTIGASNAIPPLVHLLINGTPRGKKDAATALFNLSIFHENKARIVRAGAIKPLVELMADPAAGMVDKAVAVLTNLATIPEGRVAIGEEGGIPALVEVVEAGSQRGKENAAAALLQLCMNSHKHRALVLQEGAIPPLVALSQSGTARAKEKASALLRHFREQRHQVPGPPGPDRHAMGQYYI